MTTTTTPHTKTLVLQSLIQTPSGRRHVDLVVRAYIAADGAVTLESPMYGYRTHKPYPVSSLAPSEHAALVARAAK